MFCQITQDMPTTSQTWSLFRRSLWISHEPQIHSVVTAQTTAVCLYWLCKCCHLSWNYTCSLWLLYGCEPQTSTVHCSLYTVQTVVRPHLFTFNIKNVPLSNNNHNYTQAAGPRASCRPRVVLHVTTNLAAHNIFDTNILLHDKIKILYRYNVTVEVLSLVHSSRYLHFLIID